MATEKEAAFLEFMKIWYSVFCTIMDAWVEGEYTDHAAIDKLLKLRNSLTTRLPEVEAELIKKENA